MQQSHLAELAELEDSYWWHVAKRDLAVSLLRKYAPAPGLLVEGGIGSSRNLVEFQNLGYDVHGFDIMPEAVSYGRDKGIESVSVHDLNEPWPIEPKSARAVVLLDVLEHTSNPIAVLQHIRRILTDDGAAILTVPAYPWMFSEWDRLLGHFRRYTIRMLNSQVQEAGLRAEWAGHWNSFTLPAAMAVRGLSRFRKPSDSEFPRVSRAVNSMLLGAARMERRLLLSAGMPVGLSIVAVLKKNTDSTAEHVEPPRNVERDNLLQTH